MPEAAIQQYQRRFRAREERFGLERRSVDALPVLDISALTSGGSEPARRSVGQEIRDACINSGFFYITNYGISAEDWDAVAETMRSFFGLPQDVKDRVRCVDLTKAVGYQPIFSETITPGYQADFKEIYDIGLDWTDPAVPALDRGTTLWPGDDVLPGFRPTIQGHLQKLLTLSQSLMRGFALSLDLDEAFFDAAHRVPYFDFRTNHYPPAADVLAADRWSCGPHCDNMALTMLWQDEIGGLEVMNLAGDWIQAPPIRGTLVVNIGDILANWTNDLYTSNPHRVANRADRARLSMPTFVGPGADTIVRCLDTCQSATNPPRYAPITTAQHMNNVLGAIWDTSVVENVDKRDAETSAVYRSPERVGA